MSADEPPSSLPTKSGEIVRLFPLPSVVFFPHAVLPLHIFEPRYCEMLEDALATDRQIAMTLLLPGWEKADNARPAIASMTCVGSILSHTRLPAGRHNIVLAGMRRAAIARELTSESKPYRRAKVEPIEDFYPASGAAERPRVQRKLLDAFRQFVPKTTLAEEQFEQLINQQISLGMLTDVISFTINMPLPLKQQLLSEWRVDRRAAMLQYQLEQMLGLVGESSEKRPYPPEFSAN